jgi:acyl carrier protein
MNSQNMIIRIAGLSKDYQAGDARVAVLRDVDLATQLPGSDEVLDLVASVLELDRSLLQPDLTIEELGVDSLDVLKLTYAIEKRYRINLSAYSYDEISSIGRLLELLAIELSKSAP